MSDDVLVWSDVSVNVESARGSAVAIQSISQATPGVAGATGHGFNDDDVIVLRVKGMREVNQLVCVVASKTTDTFEFKALEDGGLVDTTDFHAFISGTAELLTFDAACETITDVNPSGGEAKDIESSTIHNTQDVSIPGNSSPLVYALGSQWKPSDPALLALKAFARNKSDAAVQVVFSDGTTVYFIAKPSVSFAPGGSAGGIVTTPLKLNVQGPLTFFGV